jgi:hypothetical protein
MRSSLSAVAIAAAALGTAALTPSLVSADAEGLPSIGTPDVVETPIGTLHFTNGVPSDATVAAAYDNLDRMRAVEVFLRMLPAVSMQALRAGNQGIGQSAAHEVVLFEDRIDSRSLYLTADPSTVLALAFLDLERDGPTVLEVPPGMQGALHDAWLDHVADVGTSGADQGAGGRYLALPSDYTGFLPEGYFVVRPATRRVLLVLHGMPEDGDPEPAAAAIRKGLRVYPLAQAVDQPRMKFIDASGRTFSTVPRTDFGFYQDLDRTLQEEPLDSLDPETRGLVAAIGIAKGKAFDPDERMTAILGQAAAIGDATARSLLFQPRDPRVHVGPEADGTWLVPTANDDPLFLRDGARDHDARSMFFFAYTGVGPALSAGVPGRGANFAVAYRDSGKRPLDGANTYRLHLPADVPAADFWALTLYDTQTRSMLQTSQRVPSLGSQSTKLVRNEDGSVDLWFAPEPPEGRKRNWLETIPGKGWFVILRLHGPHDAWLDGSWRPAEIELAPE